MLRPPRYARAPDGVHRGVLPPLTAALLVACVFALGACANALQDKPIGAAPLETVIVKSRFPVYWVGTSIAGMKIGSVTVDPGGAVTIKYGDCTVGGQYTCVTPLSIVTSPDNSFIPGAKAPSRTLAIRGARATAGQGARTLAIPTGGVIVNVYANRPGLAAAAASMMAPLNTAGLPLGPLPAAVPDTGFERVPLPGQVPAGAAIPTAPSQ